MSDRYEELVEQLRADCHANYNGGHDGEKCETFHHGMDTVCNVLAAGFLRRVAEEAQQPLRAALEALRASLEQARAEERYWRHDVVTTRLCPVDHKQPHVSHDCATKIKSELSAAREQVRRLREAGLLLLDAYGEAHALYDLGDCEGSVLMRAALAETAQRGVR